MPEISKVLSAPYIASLSEDLYINGSLIARKGEMLVLSMQSFAETVIYNGAQSVKNKMILMDSDISENSESIIEINTKRNQVISATITNRGVVSGATLTKSANVKRKLSLAKGRVFMDGREFSVSAQTNAVYIAQNTEGTQGTVIVYLQKSNNVMTVGATALNGSLPANTIEIARVTVPANSTESSDPYLANSTLISTARIESAWPNVQATPGQVYVALNKTLPNTNYMVDVEVISASSFDQVGQVLSTSKGTNGFSLMTTGIADNIVCRCHVKHPSL